jgi:hypothetical protein
MSEDGPKIGDAVTFVNPVGKRFGAVVTANWGTGPTPSINVVYVTDDEAKTDSYGRQIERSTSVVHQSNQAAHGMYWY